MPTIDAAAASPLRTAAEGVLVALRVQPNAGRTAIDGVSAPASSLRQWLARLG